MTVQELLEKIVKYYTNNPAAADKRFTGNDNITIAAQKPKLYTPPIELARDSVDEAVTSISIYGSASLAFQSGGKTYTVDVSWI